MPSNKETYRSLCETEGSKIPLFLHAWWMDAVCQDKEWDVALARTGDRLLAAMPYLLRSRMGMRYVLQPQLTPYNGPYFLYPHDCATASRRTTFEHHAMDLLLRQLEELKLDYFQQNFSPLVTNWLPFCWQGYRQCTRYTYLLPDINDPDSVFRAFDSQNQRQRKIRKLLPLLHLKDDMEVDDFATLHQRYCHSRGRHDLLPQRLIKQVCHAAIARRQGVILAVEDGQGKVAAATFYVYDDHSTHALIMCQNPENRVQNAADLLIWLSIRYFSSRCRCFDFEGSMLPSVEHYYRSFGAQQIPFFEVTRCHNPLFRLLLHVQK